MPFLSFRVALEGVPDAAGTVQSLRRLLRIASGYDDQGSLFARAAL